MYKVDLRIRLENRWQKYLWLFEEALCRVSVVTRHISVAPLGLKYMGIRRYYTPFAPLVLSVVGRIGNHQIPDFPSYCPPSLNNALVVEGNNRCPCCCTYESNARRTESTVTPRRSSRIRASDVPSRPLRSVQPLIPAGRAPQKRYPE